MHSPYTCWLCIFSRTHHVRHHHPAHYYYYPITSTPRALHIPVLPHSTELTQCTQYIGHPLNIVNHHTQLTIPFSIYITNAHTYRLRYTLMQLIPLISTDTTIPTNGSIVIFIARIAYSSCVFQMFFLIESSYSSTKLQLARIRRMSDNVS